MNKLLIGLLAATFAVAPALAQDSEKKPAAEAKKDDKKAAPKDDKAEAKKDEKKKPKGGC